MTLYRLRDGHLAVAVIVTLAAMGMIHAGGAFADAQAPAAGQTIGSWATPTTAPAGKSGPIPLPDLLGVSEEMAQLIESAHADATKHPDDPEKVGRLGLMALRITQLNAAFECLERAARLAPKEMKWRYYLGLAFEDAYELPKAQAAYQAGLALDETYAPLMVRLADLLREKNVAEAESYYRKAQAISPGDPQVSFGLGECARLAKRSDEAIQHYQKAVQLAPKFAKAHGALARLYEAKGDKVNAGIHADAEKRGREPPIVKDPLYIEMMSVAADGAWLFDLAGQLIEAGDVDYAATIIAKARAWPKYEEQANRLLGRLHFRRGELDDAVRYLELHLKEFTGDHENRLLYAEALLELKRFKEAERQFRFIVRDLPQDADAHYRLGVALLFTSEAQARKQFEGLVKLAPKHTGGRVGLVVACVAGHDAEAGAKAYVAARSDATTPEDLDRDVLILFLRVRGVHLSRGDTSVDTSALAEFAAALESRDLPESAKLMRDYLRTVVQFIERATSNADFGQAFNIIQQCIDADEGGTIRDAMSRTVQHLYDLSPENCRQFLKENEARVEKDPMPAHLMAWIRATAKQPALRDAEKALRMAQLADKAADHRNPEILDTLAAACAESGDFTRAVSLLEEALRLTGAAPSPTRSERLQQRKALYEKKTPYRH